MARLVAETDFEGVYVSGAVLSADLGLPDVGLTTLSEVAARGGAIAAATDLPTLVDADTGFGEPLNAARTTRVMEAAGLAGMHLEDQVNPERCGHLDHKAVVSTEVMRARAVEGLAASVDRAKAYVDAGADMIFAEALADEGEFAAFRAGVDVPLLANTTEFGKSELLSAKTLADLGIDVVIHSVTTLRIAMGAVEAGLRSIAEQGTAEHLVPGMQTRARLYELLDYADHAQFDADVFDSTLGSCDGRR